MSNEYAIKVDQLSKVYKLYNKPTDRLKESLNPFKKKYHRDFYALDKINFDVKKGETLGIIGKNGSGKSTLLKIITGILSPTQGRVSIKGRVSALLELGAGFNPELTGLENVYLNGSLLGFSRKEMDEKLGSILEFADIGDFINQPIKMYSSGMFVRLAFALAVNVEPEILIVDEALSVGDIRFQQKCFRKIREFKSKGTVLMVSHDLGAITNFCDRVIWINEGVLFKEGLPDQIMDEYHAFMNYGEVHQLSTFEENSVTTSNFEIAPIAAEVKSFGQKGAVITGASFYNKNGELSNMVCPGEEVELRIEVESNIDIIMPLVGFILKDRLGNGLVIVNTEFENYKIGNLIKGEKRTFRWKFRFPKIKDGLYSLDLAVAEGTYHNHTQHHWLSDAVIVEVKSKNDKYNYAQGLILVDDISLQVD
ncbi:ABC transporter ATP-binding protein [Paenibacillus cellulositrophicus]|uniref:ABC transporter ATP-binding protein n=1 Tax=Paenibacillus cellulositrophicus TaxID=562959 RepID=UPI003F7F7D23